MTVKLGTSSLKKVVEARLWVNGEEKKTWAEKPFEVNLKLDDNLYTLRAKISDKDGNTAEREIKIGVNKPWDWTPSPTPTPTPLPTSTPVPTATAVPTVVPTGIGST